MEFSKTGSLRNAVASGFGSNEVRNPMADLVLEAHENGTILPVQAQPKAKKNGLAGCHDGALKVQVTQAPEKGKANGALEKVIAKSLGLKKSQVALLSGATSTR